MEQLAIELLKLLVTLGPPWVSALIKGGLASFSSDDRERVEAILSETGKSGAFLRDHGK